MVYEITEQKKVGLGLIGFGLSFTFLGVILYFDRGLLALGNLFWLIGVGLLLGWQSTWRVFTNVNNLRGTVCFVLGLFLIFVRWPIVGIILEIYGVIVLFGGFWSTVKAFLSQIPFVGWIIQYPLMVSNPQQHLPLPLMLLPFLVSEHSELPVMTLFLNSIPCSCLNAFSPLW
ncbi:Vesicle transport protein Got1/SFT2-like [Arabidopsis suecica]|uniref:Vesicle transport protein Got1/SFT2-like n=1 Tax=Arabidopsis suecica TaxID=45249 RepID=A0A8T2H0W0_ARASU|nr:Vesicle transport protein Got1/SFT2-like [Arabidopsis suecica]